jgi:hypothetical protein
MWECSNCQEKIEDRYKRCWNCGKPKFEDGQNPSSERIHRLGNDPPVDRTAPVDPVPPVKATAPKEESAPKEDISLPAELSPAKESPPVERTSPPKILPAERFPFANENRFEEGGASKIGRIVPLVLWLAAAAAVSYFAYFSSQKTKAFENRVAEEARNLSAQTNAFAFSPTAPRERHGGGGVRAKILPLDAKTKQLDGLYYSLPDDLRPATLDEAQTLLWLDCHRREAWRYDDGSPGFRETCNAYLVDRNTSRILQVEEFSGEMPPMTKPANGDAAGKVLPQAYIAFIRANQPENERKPLAFASDSPEHHVWFKSELLYALILLGLLAAIGVGWIIYQIKSVLARRE